MCLFLEILWAKKYRNLSVCVWGGIFPYHIEYFSHAENLDLLFCSTAFALTHSYTTMTPFDAPGKQAF